MPSDRQSMHHGVQGFGMAFFFLCRKGSATPQNSCRPVSAVEEEARSVLLDSTPYMTHNGDAGINGESNASTRGGRYAAVIAQA